MPSRIRYKDYSKKSCLTSGRLKRSPRNKEKPIRNNRNFMQRLTLCLSMLAAVAMTAQASDWAGNAGLWSSDGDPGWNGTGVPNAIGAIANFGSNPTVNSATTQDIVGGVTVGTISYSNTANFSRTITNTNGITMNQDGAGAGFATISNSNPTIGTANALIISAGTLTLADDLLISNTGGSTNTTGAIQIVSAITGTGNVTLSNTSTALSQTGSIRLVTGVNTFVGSVLVQRGTVTFNTSTAFGNSANLITLGQAGQGSAAILSTAGGSVVANPIVVATGTGGTSTIGSTSNAGATTGYSGLITLNGDLSVTSASTTGTNTISFSNTISGVGGLTKIGAGSVTLSGMDNSYQGGTTINSGTLIVTRDSGLGTGNVSLTAAGVTLTLQNGAVNNYINDNASISIVDNAIANLNFMGTDVVSGIILGGVPQTTLGTYGAAGSGAQFEFAHFAGTGTLTLIPEPSTYMLLGVGLLFCAQRFRRKQK
jgi:autotransporter-associated beta strand protein